MDIVVGHGVKLGRQVQFIRDSAQFSNCKWVQVVHTAPEHLSRYKCYSAPISKGETKHESEVELCKLADLVVPVGPRLKKAYTTYLQRCKSDQGVLSITPGLFQREFGDLVAKQCANKDGEFKVLLFGRGDHEDFELKGYNIAAEAFTDQRLKNKPYHLIFVGAPERKQEEVRRSLLQRGIEDAQLTVRKFIQSRDRLKDLLCEADLAIMPSKSEGFGLVALEALSAGLPILVGSSSGFAGALENVPHGNACIVNSDEPAEWAKEIDAVRTRHGMRLQEIESVRASYGKIYSWKEQCETFVNRMRGLGRVVRPRYHPGTDFVYNMTAARPRGITLIINNMSFAHHPEHRRQLPRRGSEVDVSRVETLFHALDFSVRAKQDLSKEQLLMELDDVARQDHSAYDCFVLWLMSHGRGGEVFCSDGNTVTIEILNDMFSECKTLSGKPKLFFIEACRGTREDVVGKDSADSNFSPRTLQADGSYELTTVDSVVPKYSDFLYAFSAVDEYMSYRDENEGSPYVRCFVEAFREHVAHDHILDILTIVNHEVSKIDTQRPTSSNKTKICKQMPEIRHTLRKKVRF